MRTAWSYYRYARAPVVVTPRLERSVLLPTKYLESHKVGGSRIMNTAAGSGSQPSYDLRVCTRLLGAVGDI